MPIMTNVTRTRNPRGQGERLRKDLIESALDLLSITGDPDQVSIRAVAKSAGVSPTAAYRHFDDRDALITAACDQCFSEFTQFMLDATATIPDPFERLSAASTAYLSYARAESGHYRVLFSRASEVSSTEGADFPVGGDPAGTAFQQLVVMISDCLEAGAQPTVEGDATYLGFLVWTWVHGIADLANSHPLLPWPDLDAMVADTQHALGLVRPATLSTASPEYGNPEHGNPAVDRADSRLCHSSITSAFPARSPSSPAPAVGSDGPRP